MSADDESALRQRADDFARTNAKRIAADFLADFSPAEVPVSIFMAGSPGAGKTEFSKSFLRGTIETEFSKRFMHGVGNVARIDTDELRDRFAECGYDGANSHLFQKAATRLVHEIHNLALKRKISFLLDGTFANESVARQNIERSLKRDREVFVMFIYQSPQIAWDFVQRREEVEGRRILAEDFAHKFCASHAVVDQMKAEFGDKITLSLVIKSIDNTGSRSYHENIRRLDDHISEQHSAEKILALIEKTSTVEKADV